MLDRNKIKKLIKNSGGSTRQIALTAGISPQNLYSYLNGRLESMELITAFKLADSLGVKLDDLRKGEQRETSH